VHFASFLAGDECGARDLAGGAYRQLSGSTTARQHLTQPGDGSSIARMIGFESADIP